MMYMKHILCDDPIENVTENGEVIGFKLKMSYPNYRGAHLAFILDIRVILDGEIFQGDDITVTLRTGTFKIKEFATMWFPRWNFAEKGEVFVRKPGGIPEGKHHIEAGFKATDVRGWGAGENDGYVGTAKDFVMGPTKLKLGVSLYSFQDDVKLNGKTWEDCLAYCASIGAKGIEIVPEETLNDFQYETIDPNFVAWWKDMMAKYDLEPTNCNLYDDATVFQNRFLTADERFAHIAHGMDLAKALGFKSVRACTELPLDILERTIDYGEYVGIIESVEVHAPCSLKSVFMEEWFNLIERKNTKFAGIHPDAGIFTCGLTVMQEENLLRRGENPEIVAMIKEEIPKILARRAANPEIVYQGETFWDFKGVGTEELVEKVKAMGGSPMAVMNAGFVTGDDPAWLKDVAKYIVHFHGKFYDMVPDGKGGYSDPSINYPGIVKALTEAGYQGYISSEYEGQRNYWGTDCQLDAPSGMTVVAQQHNMIRCLEADLAD